MPVFEGRRPDAFSPHISNNPKNGGFYDVQRIDSNWTVFHQCH
jgi:hypothetical protein